MAIDENLRLLLLGEGSGEDQLPAPPAPEDVRTHVGLLDRPTISFARLLEGNIPAAARAAFAPESLSPSERTTLADKWGLADGPFKSALRVVENPLFLVGAVLALRFPIPTAKNLFKFAPQLEGLQRRPGMLRLGLGPFRGIGNIDAIYHGLKAGKSTLPEVYKSLLRDVDQFYSQRSDQVARAIGRYESAVGREMGARESILLGARLDGLEGKIFKPIRMGPAFDRLATDVRGVLDDVWTEVFEKASDRSLLTALQEAGMTKGAFVTLREAQGNRSKLVKRVLSRRNDIMRGVTEQLRNAGINTGELSASRKRGEYFPRRISQTLAEWEKGTQAMVQRSAADLRGSELAAGESALVAAGRVSTPHALARRNRMIPDPRELEVVRSDLINPRLVETLKGRLSDSSSLKAYTLRADRSMSSYLHSTARAYGWTVKGHGENILDAALQLESSRLPHNKVRAGLLRDAFIPVALGRQTYRQFVSAASWDDMRYGLVQKLRESPVAKLIPADLRSKLTDWLVLDRGPFSSRNVQGKVANYLYLGALGANPVSATYNLLQTVLTTAPVIGIQDSLRGAASVMRKAPNYFKAPAAAGLDHTPALAKAFPEFRKALLSDAPLTEDVLQSVHHVASGLNHAWLSSGSLGTNAARLGGRVKTAMMGMFRTTEAFDRLTAFEGTMLKARREGLSASQALPIARRVVEATQFIGGPASTPAALLHAGPILRQFGTFTANYLNFMAGTSTELGSGAQAGGMFGRATSPRNYGTLGRALAYSTGAYGLAKEFLDVDLSRGLATGAAPLPIAGQPFYPFPFVPPVVGLAGAAAEAIGGDPRALRRAAPLLVPGGVAASRALPAVAPGVSRALGREFADYDHPTEDGRIPLHTPDGRLRAYVTPAQLWLHSLGLVPGGVPALREESELTQFAASQGRQIAAYKREYIDAMYHENDARKADSIQREYMSRYPGFGPLQVRDRDIRAVELRYTVSRLERVLEQVPADAREQVGQIISAAMMQEMEGLTGVHPDLFSGGGTIQSRDGWRNQGGGGGIVNDLARRTPVR